MTAQEKNSPVISVKSPAQKQSGYRQSQGAGRQQCHQRDGQGVEQAGRQLDRQRAGIPVGVNVHGVHQIIGYLALADFTPDAGIDAEAGQHIGGDFTDPVHGYGLCERQRGGSCKR